jgi:hypothetical protein
MTTVYDKISELNEMCRKLEAMSMEDMLPPLRTRIAVLAMPSVAGPIAQPDPDPEPPLPQPIEPEAPQRRAKRSIDTLVGLYRRGLLNNDEVCYIKTNDHEERYRIRFTNNNAVFFYPPEAKELFSPAAVSKHHASQIYEGHPQPTKPGNGWIYIKLLDREHKTLAEYCDMHDV